MSTGVVITGFGTVGPHGVGAEDLATALRDGRTAWQEVDRSEGLHLPDSARQAGFVPLERLRPWLDRNQARRMSRPSRFAVAAARMAFEHAGLAREEMRGQEVAVVLGTAFGPGEFAARLMDQILAGGPENASPFLFMESVANVHAGQVALDSGLCGPNATITQREVSALLAVNEAVSFIQRGRCMVALAGATDEVATITHAAFDRLGALARDQGEGEQARPFDRRRNGMMLAEGATVVVLEDEEYARRREAPVRLKVEAIARAHDPTASRANWGTGALRLAHALRKRLEAQQIALRSVDALVSGANGSRSGDRLEARVIRELFSDTECPAVYAPKAVTGECSGGYLGAALAGMTAYGFGPPVGPRQTDPELGVVVVDGRERSAPHRALVSGLAVGGGAAWLVLSQA